MKAALLFAALFVSGTVANGQIISDTFSEGTVDTPVTLDTQHPNTPITESWTSNTDITTNGTEAVLPFTEATAYTGYLDIPTRYLSSSDLKAGATFTLSFGMSKTGGDQWTAVGFGTFDSTSNVPYQGGNVAGFWALDNGGAINIFDEVGGTLHDLGNIGGSSGAVTLTIEVGAMTDTLSATVNGHPVTLSTTSVKVDPIDEVFVGDYSASGTVSDLVLSIPEPSTYAMMLGGLALLGFCVRRKVA